MVDFSGWNPNVFNLGLTNGGAISLPGMAGSGPSASSMFNAGNMGIGGMAPMAAGIGAGPLSSYDFSGLGGAKPAAPAQQGLGAIGGIQAGLSGLQTLGNLWMGWQANKMAKKSFKFQKDITETNLANSIKSYNTALSDRARSRGFTEGQDQGTIDRYVADNSMSRHPTGA